MQELIAQALCYLRGVWSNRWIGLSCAMLVSLCGWIFVYMMPDVYQANARFYLDASSRLRDVVKALGMEPDVTSRVFLVRQAMTGRPQLEHVAREADLDITVQNEIEHEMLITRLKQNIKISTGRGREGQNMFTISYQHQDGKVAFNVVDEMLNSFVDDVLKQKDTDTERTREFLSDQLGYYRDLLENTEEQLQQFKRQHPSFVVGDRGDYFTRLQGQGELLEEALEKRQILDTRRSELKRQLDNINPYATSNTEAITGVIPGSEMSARLVELRRQRGDLLLRVTERHPDVVALTEQIKLVQNQLQEELARNADESNDEGVGSATNPVYIEVQTALRAAKLELAQLDGEVAQIRRKLTQLEDALNAAPELEGNYIKLMRDYENYQKLYAQVLNQSERERIGRVGDQSDVISFNIIDPPRSSVKPVAPNRTLLLGAVSVLSIGFGIALALGLWLLKPTVHFERDLAEVAPFPVIGSVTMNTSVIGQVRRGSIGVFVCAAAVLLACTVAVIVVQEPASLWLRSSLASI